MKKIIEHKVTIFVIVIAIIVIAAGLSLAAEKGYFKKFTDSKIINSYETLVKKGEEAEKNKDFTSAEKYYAEALSKKPEQDDLRTNLANLYYRDQKIDQAMELWQEQTESNPDNIMTINYIANGYRDKGDTENAIKYYKIAIEKGNTDSVGNLVTLYNINNRYDDSINLLNDLLVKSPDNKTYLKLLASSYAKKGEVDKGNKILEGIK